MPGKIWAKKDEDSPLYPVAAALSRQGSHGGGGKNEGEMMPPTVSSKVSRQCHASSQGNYRSFAPKEQIIISSFLRSTDGADAREREK